jgi:hypothetical protein
LCEKYTASFHQCGFSKEFCSVLSYGHLCGSKTFGLVCRRVSKTFQKKLDMGKSCIRFKKMEDIPFELMGELCSKITVDEWIASYEKNFKK